MPLTKVKRKGRIGWKWGEQGKAYFGPGAKAKARKQMRAILATGWTENYNPGQPRDSHGRWSSGGGGGSIPQTQTKEFKEWFGNSKVVDGNGDPLVVYKGMYPYDWTKEGDDPDYPMGPEITSIGRTTEFPSFQTGEPGVQIAGFFGDQETASRFAMKGSVYPVYLSIQNPYIIDAKGKNAGDVQFGPGGQSFRDAVRSGDYDGVIIKGTADENDIYVALKPTQIKSASGNRGTFDPDDPIITHAAPDQKKRRTVNPLKLDPTRSATLRRKFTAEIARRLNLLKRRVRKLVAEDDVFGMKDESPSFVGNDFTVNQRWKFHTSQQKLHLFQTWLKQQLIDVFLGDETTTEDDWWAEYIREGYRKGAGRAFDDTRKPYARIECLPADTCVSSAVVRAVFRRWYDGDMVEIETSSGRKFSATPNHPMLTNRGWVAAGLLNDRDYLVCNDRQEDFIPGNPDVQRGPTTIGKIFDSLYATGTIEREVAFRVDFHGDGVDGKVDIHLPNGELRIGVFTPIDEETAKFVFSPTDMATLRFCDCCHQLLPVNKTFPFLQASEVQSCTLKSTANDTTINSERFCDACHSLVVGVPRNDIGNVQISPVVGDPSSFPRVDLRLGVVPASDSMIAKDSPNQRRITPDLGGDLFLGHPPLVQFDRVSFVRLSQFSGHVYNLETPCGYFIAGSFYTGNTSRSSYARGYAEDESTSDFYNLSKYEFLQSSFANPQRKEKVLLLASRTFTDLKGVTEQMATVMSRTLVDGFVQGKSPWDVAKDLERNVDGIGRNRANLIARTECLPAETLVDRAVVRAVFRRWYDGDMVEVVTANGRKFSATPNHPMLTKDGWISAGLLKQGDDLVRDAREQYLGSFGDQNKHSRPSTLGEIYRSLSIVGIPERTTCSPNDFHGDGVDGDVDILRPNRELMVGRFSPIFEPLAKDVFSESGFRDSTFCPFCGCLLSINQQTCFCGRSKTNPVVDESSFDDASFDSSGDCDFGDRLSVCISGCDIFHIDAVDELIGNTSFLPRESLPFGVGSADSSFSQDVANSLLIGIDPSSDFLLSQSGLVEEDDHFLPFVVEADSDLALLQCFDGCFGVGSGDPSVSDHLSDSGSVEPNFDCYISDGESLRVEFDRVVSVNVRHFSGHVYNLETPFGYYTIDSLFTGNTIRAHAEGQLDAFVDLGVEEVGVAVEWATAEDDRVCSLCEALHGVVMKVDEARGLIPRHPQCVIGDTRVWSPSPTAILRAEYSGQIFEIVTAKGRSLSVTENHVLLTHRGWVRAKEITEGDYLVDASTLNGEVFQHPYYDENVPCIEDLHASLLKEGRVCLQSCSDARPEDLHGDGKSINGKINIASFDGLLRNEWKSQFGGNFCEPPFMLRDIDVVHPRLFIGQSDISTMLITMGAAADSFMGFDSVSSIFLRGSFAHHQPVGLCDGSDVGVSRFNPPTDEISFISIPSGEFGERNPALVLFDHLLKDIQRNFDARERQCLASGSDNAHRFETFADAFAIALKLLGDLPGGKTRLVQTNDLSHDRVDFTCSRHVTNLPVYDMETQETVYIANGILSSNCRCAWLPANVGEDHLGQKRTKSSIGKAIEESVRREIPVRSDRTLEEQLKLTKWGGPDVDVDKNRPKSILD